MSELMQLTGKDWLPMPHKEIVQRLNLAFAKCAESILNDAADFASFAKQERKYLEFLETVKSSEELNLVILNRPNLHRLIMWARKNWRGRWRNRIMQFEFSEFTPHAFLSREWRNYILSHHPFDNEKREQEWIMRIAIESTDIEDLKALTQNRSKEIRKTLANRTWLPIAVQEVLMHDSSIEVLKELAKNLSIGENATNHLLESPNTDIIYLVLLTSRFVETRKLIEFWAIYCRDYNFLRALLDKADCPLEALLYIEAFIKEKLSDPKILKHAEVKSILDLCNKLWSHPSFPQEKRQELFRIKSDIKVYIRYGNWHYGSYRPFNDECYPQVTTGEDDDIPF